MSDQQPGGLTIGNMSIRWRCLHFDYYKETHRFALGSSRARLAFTEILLNGLPTIKKYICQQKRQELQITSRFLTEYRRVVSENLW